MKKNPSHWQSHTEFIALAVFLIVYAALSLPSLTRFPFVHSDECWLSGLSKDMLASRSLGVTESFFNAKTRYPHAIKSIFHLLQQGMLLVFGATPFSMRFLSLFAAIGFLLLFYFLLKRLTENKILAFLLLLFTAGDIWFVYLSHFARQEMLLLVLQAAILYLFLFKAPSAKRAVAAAVLTGIGIGLHPNSLLLASITCALLLSEALSTAAAKKARSALLVYLLLTALFAVGYIGISYSFGAHFLPNYFSYGAADFGLDAPPVERLRELGGFFYRLWMGQSGTYYLPGSRPLLTLLALSAGIVLYLALYKKDLISRRILAALLGLLFGLYLIGRFSQLSTLFFVPFVPLILTRILAFFPQQKRPLSYGIVAVMAAGTILFSAWQIHPWLSKEPYGTYLAHLSQYVPADAKTLANLNTGFYFAQGKLLDYRNLPYAMQTQSIASYLQENHVEYIVYTAELDYLFSHRPTYNLIYGNVMFVPELKDFCETRCTLVGQFESPLYAARVIHLLEQPPYAHVWVYRVADAFR